MPTDHFDHTGGWQSWNVPKDVKSVTVVVDGAGSSGNPAGRVTGRLAVNDGQVLKILVGEQGRSPSGPGSRTGGEVATGGGGRGGDAIGSNTGGSGGGGGTFIRRNTNDGTLLCAAGGAGGDSGDSGDGGAGGGNTGENGSPGPGGGAIGNATGGTQSQGGNGGTSSAGANLAGENADNSIAAKGGRGGSAVGAGSGGGGGGGGYRAGGGGQAESDGVAPGGGGGGGSNYTGQLTSATNEQGGGGGGDGHVAISWVNPPPANQPPSPPSNVKVDGKDEANELATKSTGRVPIEAELNDPDSGDKVRMIAWVSRSPSFSTHMHERTDLVKSGTRAEVVFTGLADDSLYYYRLWAEDEHGKQSLTYNSGNFWTNRRPSPPTLTAPADNVTVESIDSVTFDWTHVDPDPNDDQSGFQLRYRTAATTTKPAGEFEVIDKPTVTSSQWTVNPGTFKASTFYEWQVRTRDEQNLWGDWSNFRSFYVLGTTAPPQPRAPIKDDAVDASEEFTFRWRFVDPSPGEHQTKADIRYRLVGQTSDDWITVFGDIVEPGEENTWVLPQGTFSYPGYHYEWQVRSYNSGGFASDWSDTATFWTIGTPGSAQEPDPTVEPEIIGALGCGTYRVFLYDRGGKVQRGEIKPLASLQFKRVRDDISNCLLTTNGFDDDCGELFAKARCWLNEIVIFRDGLRVWEGPVTRISYFHDRVEFEAQDVMAYVYRRILRQGFNDSYRILQGEETGLPTVVDRAQRIIVNALAPSDPNILPYLTTFEFNDDARESRVVPDYSTTAWEQVDDMAANAGLDYTTVGRRIILWDTHRSIGRLPVMRDGDFSDPPVVTEYGMLLCNYFAVTNNSGVWGAARPQGEEEDFEAYGPIEMLASSYGEAEGGGGDALTPAAREKLQESMREQARRNISDRWPTPVIVRVPDNSNLNPDINVGFNQLVPGVWIPVQADGLRPVTQWQKLDSVTVTVDAAGGEKISVVMSPAPNGGEDPDADAGVVA